MTDSAGQPIYPRTQYAYTLRELPSITSLTNLQLLTFRELIQNYKNTWRFDIKAYDVTDTLIHEQTLYKEFVLGASQGSTCVTSEGQLVNYASPAESYPLDNGVFKITAYASDNYDFEINFQNAFSACDFTELRMAELSFFSEWSSNRLYSYGAPRNVDPSLCPLADSNNYVCDDAQYIQCVNQVTQESHDAVSIEDSTGKSFKLIPIYEGSAHHCLIVPNVLADGQPEFPWFSESDESQLTENINVPMLSFQYLKFVFNFENISHLLKSPTGDVLQLYAHFISDDQSGNVIYSSIPFKIDAPIVSPFQAFDILNDQYNFFGIFYGEGIRPLANPSTQLMATGKSYTATQVLLEQTNYYYYKSTYLMLPADFSQVYSPYHILSFLQSNDYRAAQIQYNLTNTQDSTETYSKGVKIEYGYPQQYKLEPMPCVARLDYKLSDLIKTRNISEIADFYSLNEQPDTNWQVYLDYNNVTCPYKLALAELLPFEDWSLKCQVNNTCVVDTISVQDCEYDYQNYLTCNSASTEQCELTAPKYPGRKSVHCSVEYVQNTQLTKCLVSDVYTGEQNCFIKSPSGERPALLVDTELKRIKNSDSYKYYTEKISASYYWYFYYNPFLALKLFEKEGMQPYLHTIWIKEDDQTMHYGRVALDVKLNGNPDVCSPSSCNAMCTRNYQVSSLIANSSKYTFSANPDLSPDWGSDVSITGTSASGLQVKAVSVYNKNAYYYIFCALPTEDTYSDSISIASLFEDYYLGIRGIQSSLGLDLPDIRMAYNDTQGNGYYGANILVVPPAQEQMFGFSDYTRDCYDFSANVLDPYDTILTYQNGAYQISTAQYESMLRAAPFNTFLKIQMNFYPHSAPQPYCPQPLVTEWYVTPYKDPRTSCKLSNLCSGYDDTCEELYTSSTAITCDYSGTNQVICNNPDSTIYSDLDGSDTQFKSCVELSLPQFMAYRCEVKNLVKMVDVCVIFVPDQFRFFPRNYTQPSDEVLAESRLAKILSEADFVNNTFLVNLQDLIYSLDQQENDQVYLFAWMVVFDENRQVDPILNRISFALQLQQGSTSSSSCYPESEPQNYQNRASFELTQEPSLYLEWGQPLVLYVRAADGSDVSMEPMYVDNTYNGCEQKFITGTELNAQGNPIQTTINFIEVYDLYRTTLVPYIRMKFSTATGTSYITTSYIYPVPPSETQVQEYMTQYITGQEPCYQFHDLLYDNHGKQIQAESDKYTINLSDYSSTLSVGGTVNLTLSVSTSYHPNALSPNCANYQTLQRGITYTPDAKAYCLSENTCEGYNDKGFNFNATDHQCTFNADLTCSCNNPMQSDQVLSTCQQVDTLFDTKDCKCRVDNPSTRMIQSYMFISDQTREAIVGVSGVEVNYAWSQGLYAKEESQILMQKSEYYTVLSVDAEANNTGVYTFNMNNLMSIWELEDKSAPAIEQTKELKLYVWEIYEEVYRAESPIVFRKDVTLVVNRNYANGSADALCNATLEENKQNRASYLTTELDPVLALDWGQDLMLPTITIGTSLTIYPSFLFANSTHCEIRRVGENFLSYTDVSSVTIQFEDAFLWWVWHQDFPRDDESIQEVSDTRLSFSNGTGAYQTNSTLQIFFPPDAEVLKDTYTIPKNIHFHEHEFNVFLETATDGLLDPVESGLFALNLTAQLEANPHAQLNATCKVTATSAPADFYAASYALAMYPDLSLDCRSENTCSNAFPSSLKPITSGHWLCTVTANEVSCPHPENPALTITECQTITNTFNFVDIRCEYRRDDTRLMQGVVYLSEDTLNYITQHGKQDMLQDERTEGLYALLPEEEALRANFSAHWPIREYNTRAQGLFKLDLAQVNATLVEMGRDPSAPYNLTSYCFAAMFDHERQGEPKLFRTNLTLMLNAESAPAENATASLRPDLFQVSRLPVYVSYQSPNGLYFIASFNSADYPTEQWHLRVDILDASNATVASFSSTAAYLDHSFFSYPALLALLNTTALAEQPTPFFYRISAIDSAGAPKFYFDSDPIYLVPPYPFVANTHQVTECSVDSYSLATADGSLLAPVDAAASPSTYFVPSTEALVYVKPVLKQSCLVAPVPSNSLVSTFQRLGTGCEFNNTCAEPLAFCQELWGYQCDPTSLSCVSSTGHQVHTNQGTSEDGSSTFYYFFNETVQGKKQCFIVGDKPAFTWSDDTANYFQAHEQGLVFRNADRSEGVWVNVAALRANASASLFAHTIQLKLHDPNLVTEYTMLPITLQFTFDKYKLLAPYSTSFLFNSPVTEPLLSLTPEALLENYQFQSASLAIYFPSNSSYTEVYNHVLYKHQLNGDTIAPFSVLGSVQSFTFGTFTKFGTNGEYFSMKIHISKEDDYEDIYFEPLYALPPYESESVGCYETLSVQTSGSTLADSYTGPEGIIFTLDDGRYVTADYTLTFSPNQCNYNVLAFLIFNRDNLHHFCSPDYCDFFPSPSCEYRDLECSGHECYEAATKTTFLECTEFSLSPSFSFYKCFDNGNCYSSRRSPDLLPQPEYPFGQINFPSSYPVTYTFVPSSIFMNEDSRTLYLHVLYLDATQQMAYKMEPLIFQNRNSTPLVTVNAVFTGSDTELILPFNQQVILSAEITNVPDTSLWVLRGGVAEFNEFTNKASFTHQFQDNLVDHLISIDSTPAFFFSKINYSRQPQYLVFSAQRLSALTTGTVPVSRELSVFWQPPETADLQNALKLEIWSGEHNFTQNAKFEITDDIKNGAVQFLFTPNTETTQGYSLQQVVLRPFTQLGLECVKDKRCQNTQNYQDADLAVVDSYLNQILMDKATTYESSTGYVINLEVEKLKPLLPQLTEPGMFTIYAHSFWTLGDNIHYAIMEIQIDATQLAGIDPDLSCDLNFCQFYLLPHINGNDVSDMWQCDPDTKRWGGRFIDYVAEWNSSHELVIVPDLSQCLVDAKEYATSNPSFDFIWTQLPIDSSLITRMASRWNLNYWYSVNGDYYDWRLHNETLDYVPGSSLRYTFTPYQILSTFGYNEYGYSNYFALCNMFDGCRYETCTWAPLPKMKEPPVPSALLTTSATKLKNSGTEVTSENGYYLVLAEEELEITIDSTQCPEPLLVELRSYKDLKQECSIRGTCDQGDESYKNDYTCWPIALNCTETSGKLTCIDNWYFEYQNCFKETISNVEIVRCFYGYHGENNYCVMSNEFMLMPWEDDYLAPCYDSAQFDNCPVNGNCVGCRSRGQHWSDCTSTNYDESDCPPQDYTKTCDYYWDFISEQYQNATFFPDLPSFEPKNEFNMFYRFGVKRTGHSLLLELGDLYRYSQYFTYYNYDTELYDTRYVIPEEGLTFYLHKACAQASGQIDYSVEEIKVKEKPVVPPPIAYELQFRTGGEILFADALNINPIRLGSNADKHTLELKLRDHPDELAQQYSAADKLEKIAYTAHKTNHTLVAKLKHTTDGSTLATAQMNVWLGVPSAASTDTTCAPTFALKQFSETTPLTEWRGKLKVYQEHSVFGEVSFPEGCDYQAKQIHCRSFNNLEEECATRGTCAPHNDQCIYASLFCKVEYEEVQETNANGDVTIKNVPIRNCYKADGTQYKGCQKLSTPNNKPFTRCDNATLNANTKALDYSCVIHLPNPSFKHPLLIAACEYQTSDAGDTLNQGCPLKKSCIDALRTNSSTPLNATECPLDSKYYKNYPASSSPFTFDTSQVYREPINSLLQQYVTHETDSAGKMRITMRPEIWNDERGAKDIYCHVFAGSSSSSEASYFRHLLNFFFATTSKPVPIVPVLTLSSHSSLTIIQPFNKALVLSFTISGIEEASNPSHYRIQKYLNGKAEGSKFDQATSHSISSFQLLSLFPYSRNALTGTASTLCFGVLLSSDQASERICLKVVLEYSTANDPTLDTCAKFFDKLTFGDYQPAIQSSLDVPYLSTSQDTQFHFTPNYASCNSLTETPVVQFATVSLNTNLSVLDCHYRGTCAIPDSACEVAIMHCDTTAATPYCVTLHGLSSTSFSAVQDESGVSTHRIDVPNQSRCLLQDQRRKHPVDQASSSLSDCYNPNEATCGGSLPHECLQVIANYEYEMGLEFSATLVEECYALYEKIKLYEAEVAAPMDKVGYNYLTQFTWNRTPQTNLDLLLRSAYFQRESLILHLPRYYGQDELQQGDVDLTFTFILTLGDQVISLTETKTVTLFQPDPLRGFKVTFSSPVVFELNTPLVITSTKDNLDPTLSTTETLTLQSSLSTCDFSSQNFANGMVSLSAATVVRCWEMFKSGGEAVLSAKAYTSEGVSLGNVDYFVPILLSPSFAPGACSIGLSLVYADGTPVTKNTYYEIKQEDLQKGSELVFTFTGTDACAQEITQWMIRSYSDFTEERKKQDLSLKNEWCSVERLSCNADGCLSQNGATLYPTAKCADETDAAGNTFTVCRDNEAKAVFSSSSDQATYKSPCVIKDRVHPHPRDRNEYSICYDSQTWHSCPSYPACFNATLNFYDFLGNTLLLDFGWSMPTIMSEFNLPELEPNVPWSSIDFSGLTAQQVVALLDSQYYVSLDTILKRAQYSKLCTSLYTTQDAAFYHTGVFEYWQGSASTSNSLSTSFENQLAQSFYRPDPAAPNIFHLYPSFLIDLMEDVNNFQEHHTFYAFALGVQASDAIYFRHEINLQLSRPETELTFTANFPDGDTVKSTQDLTFKASWEDPYYSSSATYQMSWSCTGNTLLCDRMQSLYTGNEFEQIGYINAGEMGDFNGSLEITVTLTKHNAAGALEHTKQKTLSFTIEYVPVACEWNLKRNLIYANSDSSKKSERVNIRFDHACSSFSFELQYQGVVCSENWCPAFRKKNVENGRRWLKFTMAQIPPNQAITLGVQATYSLNGVTLVETQNLDIYYQMDLEVSFTKEEGSFLAKDGIKTTLTSDFTGRWWVEEWSCPDWYQLWCNSLGRKVDIDSSFLYDRRSLIEENKQYVFKAYANSRQGGRATAKFVFTLEFDESLPQIVIKLKREKKNKVKNRVLNFLLKGEDGATVNWDAVQSISWELRKVVGDEQFESVDNTVTRRITSNFNQLTIKRNTLDPSQAYQLKATLLLTSSKTRDIFIEFTMSQKYNVGRVTLNPDTGLTTKTAVEVRFRQFQKPKFYKVFCQEGDWTTRVHLAPQDNESIKKDVHFMDTSTHSCGWVFVDRNLWRTVTFFQDTELQVAHAPIDTTISITQELSTYTSVEMMVSKSDELSQSYGTDVKVEMKAAVSTQLTTQIDLAKDENGDYDPDMLVSASSTLAVAASASFSTDVDYYPTTTSLANDMADSAIANSDAMGDDEMLEFLYSLYEAIAALLSFKDYMPETVQESILSILEKIRKLVYSLGSTQLESSSGVMKTEKVTVAELSSSSSFVIESDSIGSLAKAAVEFQNIDVISTAGTISSSEITCGTQTMALATQDETQFQGSITTGTKVEITISEGEGRSVSFTGTFTATLDVTIPALLSQTSSTVYNPVCHRFDSGTQTWTTNGITTQENQGSVSCISTQSGAVTVVYQATTTTTPTTPTSSSEESGLNVMLIAGAAGGGLFLIILIVCIICCVKRKQKKRKDASKISVNKVVPTDMTDFDQMQSVPDYDPKGRKKIVHSKNTSSTVRPMAVDDLSACSRSFDYMVNDDEGTSSNLPHRKGEVLGNSPDRLRGGPAVKGSRIPLPKPKKK